MQGGTNSLVAFLTRTASGCSRLRVPWEQVSAELSSLESLALEMLSPGPLVRRQ